MHSYFVNKQFSCSIEKEENIRSHNISASDQRDYQRRLSKATMIKMMTNKIVQRWKSLKLLLE